MARGNRTDRRGNGPSKGALNAGRPRKHFRDENKAQMIALFIGCGVQVKAIAYQFGMHEDTLRKLYPIELEQGKQLNEMFWVGSLAQAARKGSVEAIKFALARKFGWTETRNYNVSDGESGVIFDGLRGPALDDDDDSADS